MESLAKRACAVKETFVKTCENTYKLSHFPEGKDLVGSLAKRVCAVKETTVKTCENSYKLCHFPEEKNCDTLSHFIAAKYRVTLYAGKTAHAH